MTGKVVLDAATKAKLQHEANLLVRMGKPLREAKRIVWEEYLEELPAHSAAVPSATETEETAVQEGPEEIPLTATSRPDPAPPARWFWDAKDEPKLTPEWLERNRQQLAKVKRILRSK